MKKINITILFLFFIFITPQKLEARISWNDFFEGSDIDSEISEDSDLEITTENTGTQVQNSISVKSSTGSENQQQGDSKVDVKVENVVNGEVVDPIEIHVDSDSESFTKETSSENSKTRIEVNVNKGQTEVNVRDSVEESGSSEIGKSESDEAGDTKVDSVNSLQKTEDQKPTHIAKTTSETKIHFFTSVKNFFSKVFKILSWF